MSGWPDPARPGVPLTPERDGWHWLIYYRDAEPRLRMWDATGGTGWAFGPPHTDPNAVAYVEPVCTPAEVSAREAAAFKRGLDAAEEVVMRDWPDGVDGCEAVCDAIRALPLPEDKQ